MALCDLPSTRCTSLISIYSFLCTLCSRHTGLLSVQQVCQAAPHFKNSVHVLFTSQNTPSSLHCYLKFQVCSNIKLLLCPSPFLWQWPLCLIHVNQGKFLCFILSHYSEQLVMIALCRCKFHDPQHLATKFLAHKYLLSEKMLLTLNAFN